MSCGALGGPAFNLAGEVVGVAFQSLSGGDNIGYLIPSDIVRHFLKYYRQAHMSASLDLSVDLH